MSEPLLAIDNLRVQYGRFLAVDDVSFRLHGGELLGMIGPNGAGKTTTLRAACGLQPITTGSIRILGHDVFREPVAVGHHVAFTPDTPPLYDRLTVAKFLDFIGSCYGLPTRLRQERIDHLLHQLWLTEKRDAKVTALSRGMRQRLAVARSLLPDPHVVLMDEPAAGLDPAGRVQFRQLLATLRDSFKAVIVSSHILADLSEYCTHIMIMGRGKVLQFGPVHHIAGAGERARYRVVFARAVGDALARLTSLNGLTRVELQGDVATFEHERSRDAAADVLAAMVAAGLPVAEFRELAPDLEKAYLRSGIEQVD